MKLNSLTITEIVDVLPVFQPQGKKIKIENRKSYALSFCKYGKITYNHKGKIYTSTKNKVIFHPMGESYLLTSHENGEFPLIEFYLSDAAEKDFYEFEITSPIVFFNLFEQIKANLNIKNKRAKNLSLLYEIFSLLSSDNLLDKNDLLSPAISFINANFKSPDLTIGSLSKICNVSECYFRRLFNKKFSLSPKQYILNLKLSHAKQLLREGNRTVTEISELCGFESVYYFSKVFKAKEKITALEFAKRNRKNIL